MLRVKLQWILWQRVFKNCLRCRVPKWYFICKLKVLVIEWHTVHTKFVTVIHSVALSGNLNLHACLLLLLLLLLLLFVVVKKCSTFKLTKRLITILVRCHFCGFAFLWNLVCVSYCYGFTLSWITKLEESSLCTNAPFLKKKVGRETLSPIIIITLFFLFFWKGGECTDEMYKWKVEVEENTYRFEE